MSAPGLAPAPAARALMATCPHCWAGPDVPCDTSGPPGLHLARYGRAERRGLITRAELAAAISGLTVITLDTVIRGGAA